MPNIRTVIKVNSIDLYPNDFICIWLNKNNEYGKREAIQFEIVNDKDGNIELRCTHPLTVKPFEGETWGPNEQIP